MQLAALDWLVVALYFAGTFAVAIWATWQEKHRAKETSADYFLAGRHAGWFIIGASLFASNIGAEHLVGLAGTGASKGVVVGQFEVQASLMLALLGWLFVPFYLRSGVFTMPEFLERRFSPACRWYMAIVSIIGYVLTKIAVNIVAGGLVLSTFGVNFWVAAITVVVVTGVYTIFGGMRAVLYTDMVQMFVFLGGGVAVIWFGLARLGGWDELVSIAGESHLSMWKPMTDPDFPWTGILFGAPILGMWYWCTDQFIVQRVLSAPNMEEARRGSLFAGLLKLLPLFLFVLPGVIAFCLVKAGKLELDVENQAEADKALPTLVQQLLPVGLRGLVVAGLLAAIMSSLSSVFNSCSTLITWDIYKKLRPQASERQLVLVGQSATAVMVVLGLAWIPLMSRVSPQIYSYLQSVQAYIAPPITAVFFLGLLWKRINRHGAIVSLVAGFILGMGRLGLELTKDSYVEETMLHRLATINFLHVAIGLLGICTALLVIVSLLTPPEDEKKLAGLTVSTVPPADRIELSPEMRREHQINIGLTIVLVGFVAAIWTYFSPWMQ
jgi:solute:Na+ symporter, SSS family